MRNLASIQKVAAVEPIEGADQVELVHILGWQCVATKGQFHPNDLCVYFEIDSFLPVRPEYEFLRSSSYRDNDFMGKGFRIKTMKFRGQISQGLVMPLGILASVDWSGDFKEGTDLTSILGVKLWEVPETVSTGGTILGELPPCVLKPDETEIQNCPDIIAEFNNHEFYITTKLDGSSHSIAVDENGFHVTGYSYEYKDDGESAFYELVKARGYQEKIEAYAKQRSFRSFTLQGEFCAPGIQHNRLKLSEPEWYVFSIYIDGKRVGLRTLIDVCAALNIPMVPLEEVGTGLHNVYPDVDSLLKRAEGSYPNGGPKEGIVIRTTQPEYSRTLSGPLSIKVLNNKYLLKDKD